MFNDRRRQLRPLRRLFQGAREGRLSAIIDGDERCVISAVNAHETAIVLRGKLGNAAVAQFWQWLAENRIEVVPFDEIQARAASEAYGRFGKGIHSKASLNLSDCAAYALSKTFGAPLLFKGDDFLETDVQSAA